MAGYSSTPLVKKLGLKPGMRVFVSAAPEKYFDWLYPLPEDIEVLEKPKGSIDFAHLFVTDQKTFRKHFITAKKALNKDGMMWISWPKKSSKIDSDLDENIIRDYGLKEGLVDVKVCAVDETWSGLKFMYRLKDR